MRTHCIFLVMTVLLPLKVCLTASAERNFSALKHIKTSLRNSMTQQRLNCCMLLHVHVTLTDQLDLTDCAKEFVRRNERHRNFWTFLNSMHYCMYSDNENFLAPSISLAFLLHCFAALTTLLLAESYYTYAPLTVSM